MEKPKGYPTASGYMGLIGNRYILFATETDYLETLTCDKHVIFMSKKEKNCEKHWNNQETQPTSIMV